MRRGFSLVDVTVSISVLSFIVYITSTSLLTLVPKYTLQKAVWEIQSRLYSARFTALFRSEKVRVRFTPGSYAVDRYNELRKEWEIEERHVLDGVLVEANNSPCFHPNGAVSNLASISIWNSWGKYKITVAITGRVKTVRVIN